MLCRAEAANFWNYCQLTGSIGNGNGDDGDSDIAGIRLDWVRKTSLYEASADEDADVDEMMCS